MSPKLFSSSTSVTAAVILLVVVVLLCSNRCSVRAQTCDSVTGCTCLGGPGTANNFSGIDFSKAFDYPLQILDGIDDDEFFFVYFPCGGGLACGDNDQDQSTAMCLFEANDTNPIPTSCGKVSDIKWSFSATNPNTFTITYLDGDIAEPLGFDRHTTVSVTIDHEAHKSSIRFTSQFSDIDQRIIFYNFRMTLTPRAASGESDRVETKADLAGLVGLLLMVLFVGAFVVYFVVGIIINYKVKGAKGVELIPNLSFWKELPYLLKDGCCFTISPIRKLISGESTRYERQYLISSMK